MKAKVKTKLKRHYYGGMEYSHTLKITVKFKEEGKLLRTKLDANIIRKDISLVSTDFMQLHIPPKMTDRNFLLRCIEILDDRGLIEELAIDMVSKHLEENYEHKSNDDLTDIVLGKVDNFEIEVDTEKGGSCRHED